jgi:hypothetical protein
MADYCNDCGNKVYGGYCTWCHEEVFIAEQYERSDEPVPDLLLEKIATFEPKRPKGHS